MSVAWWLNTAWMISSLRAAKQFNRSLGNVRQAQWRVLERIIGANADCEFGRRHGFTRMRNVQDFRLNVPAAAWEDMAPAIERIAAGEQGVLTSERVELLQPTSGTTRGEKLIPYTASLRSEFQHAVAAWIADLFYQRPAVRRGRAYWSISPALGPSRRTTAGIPIGFDDDTAYLGLWQRKAVQHVLAVPPLVSRLEDMESWRYCTLLYLLAAEDLSLVSVWSPNFWTTLMDFLPRYQEQLCRDLFNGACRPSKYTRDARCGELAGTSRTLRRRAREVDAIFAAGTDVPTVLHRLWPKLALISAWGDASAVTFLPPLRGMFPNVELQPKGLLATEGCVSIPLAGRDGCALAIDSHFFEFEPDSDAASSSILSGDWHLADELMLGRRYRVVITTGGGLYRYQLRDVIEVVGFERDCPLVRFVGKADRVGDLVGEKLAEPFVRKCFERVCAELRIIPAFALVVPVVDARPPHYRLYLATFDGLLPDDRIAAVQARLQAEFLENPYYDHAIQLGQLSPSDVRQLACSGGSAWNAFADRCAARGQPLGAVKPTVFDPSPDWTEVFEPMVVQRRSAGNFPQPVG